ncbi:MAG: VTC domain-containing protein, partial [Ruminococcaceae bacterium]|nr:VTC domain-containing protein [Oscillospiraceae bacterium]
TPILPEGKALMEIKCSGGIPLWMTEVLSREKIYKTPFSKYGTAYRTLIFPQTHKMNSYNMMEVTQNA